MADTPLVLKAAQIAAMPFDFPHPPDENAELRIFRLAHATCLTGTSVNLAHLAPGRRSYPNHRHHANDEWLYILPGTAELELDGDSHALDDGDFADLPEQGKRLTIIGQGPDQHALVSPLDVRTAFDFIARAMSDD